MSPEPLPPDLIPMPEATPPETPPTESYPFWGYLDLLGFVLIALLGLVVESLLMSALIGATHVKRAFVLFPAQVLLYAFLLGALAFMFRRYYGRPFWQSLRWTPAPFGTGFAAICGVMAAVAVVVVSLLLRTPDNDSPMKELLSDPASVVMIALIGTTLAPMFEEIVFRGFLQPLLVRSFGAAPGILLAAAAFGLLHFQEYGNSWRHAVLIAGAGAAFGWMRHRSGSTKAAAVMHAAYNCLFFLLLALQQAAVHSKWVEHGR